MKQNMGKVDRILRLVVAVVIGFLYWNGTISGMMASTLSVLAVIFLLTSLVRFCPLYLPFGINTCEKD